MIHYTRRLAAELQVLLAIFFVAILNIIVLASLAVNQNDPLSNIITAFKQTIIVYIVLLVAGTVCMFLKKIRYASYCFYGLLVFMSGRIVFNLYSLVFDKRISDNGIAILSDAFLIWTVSLLVFSLWYWLIDRGGPVAREDPGKETRYDLLFPQYQSPIKGWEKWNPKFLDYVFFSFFTSTGFSPADTLPLTKRVKTLMMCEAAISLVIIGMIASRAISLLQ